jgi:hypothetical protein
VTDKINGMCLLSEYDFTNSKPNPYCSGTNLILLEPDIAKAFPTQAAVNHALRLVM